MESKNVNKNKNRSRISGYRRRKRVRERNRRVIITIVAAVVLLGVGILIRNCIKTKGQETGSMNYEERPELQEDFLTPNRYSRPGETLERVENIFVHYTANPGSTAKQNRDYFEQLGSTGERSASSHFIIGYEGEIIQCVPLNEIAYAVKGRNYDSISIECCHLTEDGSFTNATYDSLLELLRWLMDMYQLDKDDILRHYDSNEKLCPLYYVEYEDAWEQLKEDI